MFSTAFLEITCSKRSLTLTTLIFNSSIYGDVTIMSVQEHSFKFVLIPYLMPRSQNCSILTQFFIKRHKTKSCSQTGRRYHQAIYCIVHRSVAKSGYTLDTFKVHLYSLHLLTMNDVCIELYRDLGIKRGIRMKLNECHKRSNQSRYPKPPNRIEELSKSRSKCYFICGVYFRVYQFLVQKYGGSSDWHADMVR